MQSDKPEARPGPAKTVEELVERLPAPTQYEAERQPLFKGSLEGFLRWYDEAQASSGEQRAFGQEGLAPAGVLRRAVDGDVLFVPRYRPYLRVAEGPPYRPFNETTDYSVALSPLLAPVVSASVMRFARLAQDGEIASFRQAVTVLLCVFERNDEKEGYARDDIQSCLSATLLSMEENNRTRAIEELRKITAQVSELVSTGDFTLGQIETATRLLNDVKQRLRALEPVPSPFDSEKPPSFALRPVDELGRRPSAMEWFELHWRKRIEAGATGDELRDLDMGFYRALASALTRRGQKLSDVLPPSPTRGRKGLIRPDKEEILRSQARERMRRWREARRDPQ